MKAFICLFIIILGLLEPNRGYAYLFHSIQGTVIDQTAQSPIPNAEVTLFNESDQSRIKITSTADGKFSFILYPNKKYRIIVSESKYYTYFSDELQTSEAANEIKLLIPLQRVVVGRAVRLEDIDYELSTAKLKEESKPKLEGLLRLLQNNPHLQFEIASHSDSRGDDEYNLQLSQKRAESLAAYLTEKGVLAKQLKAVGYGEKFLINHCANGIKCSTREHLQNRRTEYMVIGFLEKKIE
jgi:peptidoglycan-associated lipoprotein